ncbi:MAG TPA: hypothetical protein VMX16_09260 [Terriglobia bacterium]|nr:hypothetical protein [Terriglobia bacterium]
MRSILRSLACALVVFSAFLRDGSVDVALGWPLRYSHSPGEVVDTRDLDALSRMVAAVSRSW